jgi:hypothetical protein
MRVVLAKILFLIVILRAVLMSGVSFSQSAEPDYHRIFKDIQLFQPLQGAVVLLTEDGTRCEVTMNQGILDGQWLSYYKNGRKKATGQYKNGIPVGKWKLWSSDGKGYIIIQHGDKITYSVRRIRKGFFRNPVLCGRGEVSFSFSDRFGKVRFRNGLKDGKVIETDRNGAQVASYQYEQGKYHGTCLWVNNDGVQQHAEYNAGIPVGNWQLEDFNGRLIDETNYSSDPYIQRIPSRSFIAEHELIWKQMNIRVICSGHPSNNELFEPDSNGISLFTILEQAFVNDETVFYSDRELAFPLFHSAQMKHVSGLDPAILLNAKPVMICFNELQYFSSQISGMNNMILHFTLILECRNKDNIFYKALPFTYFPLMYSEIGSKILHQQTLSVYLDKLLSGEYYSVLLYKQDDNPHYTYENHSDHMWVNESIIDDLGRIDSMHNLWMKMAGIE